MGIEETVERVFVHLQFKCFAVEATLINAVTESVISTMRYLIVLPLTLFFFSISGIYSAAIYQVFLKFRSS